MIEMKYDIHQIPVQVKGHLKFYNFIIVALCLKMIATGKNYYKPMSNESFRYFAELSFTCSKQIFMTFSTSGKKADFPPDLYIVSLQPGIRSREGGKSPGTWLTPYPLHLLDNSRVSCETSLNYVP